MEKNKLYVPKEDFRKRLLILRSEIDKVLCEPLTSPDSSLPSALHLVLDYMWCKRQSDLYKVFYPCTFSEFLHSHGFLPLQKDSVLLPTIVDDLPF